MQNVFEAFREFNARELATTFGLSIPVIILGVFVLKWYRGGGQLKVELPKRRPSLQTLQLEQMRLLVATQRGIILELRALRASIRAAGEAIVSTRTSETKKESTADPPFVPSCAGIVDYEPPAVRSAADVRTLVSKVLRFEEIVPRARWMDLDIRNGAEWAQNRDVHLLETVDWGGPFIFVTDGAQERGWVLPNPSYGYSPDVLKPLYPNITEAQFGNDGVDPVLVKKSNDGRWRVERSTSFH